MTRTLSVAASLAILMVALWIVQVAKVPSLAFGAGAHATVATAALATPSTDLATTAVEDLAGWPMAAGRQTH